MFDSERFNGFVKNELDNLLLDDIWNLWVFNESDLHSAAYFYIRKFFDRKAKDNIYVRCEPLLKGDRPDIVIFEDTQPRYVIELKMFREIEEINENLINVDLDKLKKAAALESVKWGFLILVQDCDRTWSIADSTLRRHGHEKVSVISINLRRKEDTHRKRTRYDEWRAEFDRLRSGQRR